MGLIESIKTVAEVLQKADNIPVYKEVINLQKDAIELVEENNQLKREIKQYKDILDIRGQIIYDKNAYWLPVEKTKDGPYCSKCWDDENKLIRLNHSNGQNYNCPKCTNAIKIRGE